MKSLYLSLVKIKNNNNVSELSSCFMVIESSKLYNALDELSENIEVSHKINGRPYVVMAFNKICDIP